MEENKSTDLFGIKSFGDATKVIVESSIKGTEKFLSIVCKPAFEEFGLFLKDKTRIWRLNNVIKTLQKSENKLQFVDDMFQLSDNVEIHPRIAIEIIEKSSTCQEDNLQEMWAGLFVSSCTTKEPSDENLFFINILNSLTSRQAKIIEFSCHNSKKIVYDNEFIFSQKFEIRLDKLLEYLETNEIYIIDRELDYLSSQGLIGDLNISNGGISLHDKMVNITPTPLAINLFVKCQGFNKNPIFYWDNVLHENSNFKNW